MTAIREDHALSPNEVQILHDIREHAARTEAHLAQMADALTRFIARVEPHVERLEKASKSPAGRLFLGRLGG